MNIQPPNEVQIFAMELSQIKLSRGCVRFIPWYRRNSSDCFGVLKKYWNNVNIWCHEFNEEAIWYTLRDTVKIPTEYLNSEKIILSLPDGNIEKNFPSHAIVSLHDESYFEDRIIEPDTYAKMLKWRK